MKKFFLLFTRTLLLSGCLYLLACNPEDATFEHEKNSRSKFLNTQKPVLEHLQISLTGEQEKITNALYLLALNFNEVIKNKELNRLILQEAKKSPSHEVKLLNLMKQDGRFRVILEESLSRGSSSARVSDSQALDQVIENMNYDSIKYDPLIYIPNLDSANFEFPPV